MLDSDWFKPDRLTVRQVLGDSYNFYNIPEYQGPYKWKDEQIEQLVQDIEESMEVGEYFIGSIILVKKKDGYDVIDGQQRLTTLTLMLAVFYQKYGVQELRKCFIDDDQLKSRIKISPRVDQRNEFYEGFLSSILIGKDPDSHRENVFSKYYYITKEILESHELLKDEETASLFLKHVLDNVSLIRIYTSSEGFAVKLFYVMNTTGTSLSNDEIIKVILYDKLNERDRETFMGDWKNIEGIRSRLSGLWQPFDSTERIFTLYSYYYLGEKPKSTVFDIYSRMIQKGESPLKIINKVKQFANSLLKLHGKHSHETELIQDDRKLYPFYYLNDKVYWQVVLASAIDTAYPDFEKLVQELFRLYYLNWISGHNSGNIRDISLKILKKIIGKEHVSQIISLAEKKISEEDLEKLAFDNLEKDVYSEKPKNWLRALLLLLEYDLYDESGVDFIEQSGQDAPSIDHILPEEWQTNHYWTEKWVPEDAARYIYKLGNMTLISLLKNSKLRNTDFITKKRQYAGNIGNEKATKFRLNDMIVNNEDWNAEALKRRQGYMLKKLKEILKTP